MKKLIFLLALLPCFAFGMIYHNVNDRIQHPLDGVQHEFTCSLKAEDSDYAGNVFCDLIFGGFDPDNSPYAEAVADITYTRNGKIIYKQRTVFDRAHSFLEDKKFSALMDHDATLHVEMHTGKMLASCSANCYAKNATIPLIFPNHFKQIKHD